MAIKLVTFNKAIWIVKKKQDTFYYICISQRSQYFVFENTIKEKTVKLYSLKKTDVWT